VGDTLFFLAVAGCPRGKCSKFHAPAIHWGRPATTGIKRQLY
jgi:hypothetical protein